MAKKSSTRIVEIIDAAETDGHGNTVLTPDAVTEIKRLTKLIDKRDQQNRKPRKKAR